MANPRFASKPDRSPTADADGEIQPLDTAQAPLAVAQIHAELEKIEGQPFEAHSRAGRPVKARYHKGTDAAVMISGGQHPNETTGIVGALRAAQTLATLPSTHFTISPLENPDGYAVHQRLRADNPLHMHHAARYTALGDDLEYRAGAALNERAIRNEAEATVGRRASCQPARLPLARMDTAAVRLCAARLCHVDPAEGLLPDHAPPRRLGSACRTADRSGDGSTRHCARSSRLQ